jgi:hypothetical protein
VKRPPLEENEDAELRSLTDVAMVQAADFGKLHDLARLGELDRPDIWSVLVEREMGTCLMVVAEVAGQDATEVSVAEDEHVIQALAPDRADEPLYERVLPRALRRGERLLDPHARYPVPELLAVDFVTITQEKGRCGLVREGVHELLSRPGGDGMLGDVEVDDAPAVVSETTRTKRTRRRAVGTVKKSIETRSWTWLARNVRQV